MKNKINVLILSFKSELLQVLEEKCFKNKHLQLSRINTGTASSYVSILKAVHSPVCMLMFFSRNKGNRSSRWCFCIRNPQQYLHPCRHSLSVIMSVAAMHRNDYKESKNKPQIRLRTCRGHFRFTLIAGFHFSYSFLLLKLYKNLPPLRCFAAEH